MEEKKMDENWLTKVHREKKTINTDVVAVLTAKFKNSHEQKTNYEHDRTWSLVVEVAEAGCLNLQRAFVLIN